MAEFEFRAYAFRMQNAIEVKEEVEVGEHSGLYLFHTMLSLTQVRTTLHLPSLSVLEECYAAGASDTGLTPDRGNPAGRKP